MPQTCLDTADAIEVAEILQLIIGWLATDPPPSRHHSWPTSATLPTTCKPSAPTWTASPFLLGSSDGEQISGPGQQ
jgi:hypothetical protein